MWKSKNRTLLSKYTQLREQKSDKLSIESVVTIAIIFPSWDLEYWNYDPTIITLIITAIDLIKWTSLRASTLALFMCVNYDLSINSSKDLISGSNTRVEVNLNRTKQAIKVISTY
jgi:hypothetical protein